MRIVLFCHPEFMRSQSMPRFAGMLEAAYRARGFEVQRWHPKARVCKWFPGSPGRKWLEYIDQYLLFPIWVRKQLSGVLADTLFVFCDQAMGPWIPLVADRPHVVHIHDLLAIRSALGDIRENPTSWTGKIYQRFIRRGLRQARHFISISHKTRADLHRFANVRAVISEVVYNGLNFPYARMASAAAQETLAAARLPVDKRGMLLHVGGGQWYKNLHGVIALYARYAAMHDNPLALWCISPPPHADVEALIRKVPAGGRVLFFRSLPSETLQAAYSHAQALLFPSLAEGFGWPLIEAGACGCPVLTTDEPPMNEIAGPAAVYVPRLQIHDDLLEWGSRGAVALESLLSKGGAERTANAEHAAQWARRFDPNRSIERYVEIYRTIMESHMEKQASRWPSTTSVQP
jgi:glycosyltransferase involved in cell wall biosynthesis